MRFNHQLRTHSLELLLIIMVVMLLYCVGDGPQPEEMNDTGILIITIRIVRIELRTNNRYSDSFGRVEFVKGPRK